MGIWDILVAAEFRPFAIAFGLVIGLLLIELFAASAGFSLFGADMDGPELDALDGPVADIGGSEVDAPEVEADIASASQGGVMADLLSWLGLGRAPFLVWFATFLTGFGLGGYAVQLLAAGISGDLISAQLSSMVALPLGLAAAARVSALAARILPRVQSSAVSRRRLVGRPAVMTGGRATQGRPAEAKVRDVHGAAHYVRIEPEEPGEAFERGEKIVLLEKLESGVFRAARLTKDHTHE